jgi:hypothetical protein
MKLMIMRKGLKDEQQDYACTPTWQDDKIPKLVEIQMWATCFKLPHCYKTCIPYLIRSFYLLIGGTIIFFH